MSAVTKLLDFYELSDCKIASLTADGTAALTYDTSIDIPGAMSIQVSPGDVRTIKITGDNKIRRVAGKALTYRIRVRHSAASFDAFAALTGGTAATGGTTPNTTSSFTVSGADVFGTVKISGLIANAKDAGSPNGANAVLTFYKCTIIAPPTFTLNETATEWEWEAEAIPTDNDDKIWDIVAHETAATLS